MMEMDMKFALIFGVVAFVLIAVSWAVRSTSNSALKRTRNELRSDYWAVKRKIWRNRFSFLLQLLAIAAVASILIFVSFKSGDSKEVEDENPDKIVQNESSNDPDSLKNSDQKNIPNASTPQKKSESHFDLSSPFSRMRAATNGLGIKEDTQRFIYYQTTEFGNIEPIEGTHQTLKKTPREHIEVTYPSPGVAWVTVL